LGIAAFNTYLRNLWNKHVDAWNDAIKAELIDTMKKQTQKTTDDVLDTLGEFYPEELNNIFPLADIADACVGAILEKVAHMRVAPLKKKLKRRAIPISVLADPSLNVFKEADDD